MIKISNTLYLDATDLEEKFIRSPGAGGQKVNKTETAVQLRFDARGSGKINHAVFLRLQKLAGQLMTKEGVIVITAHQFRTQEQNRTDARDRLKRLILKALVSPKKRRATKPTKASQKRRLESKKRSSHLKRTRSKVRDFD